MASAVLVLFVATASLALASSEETSAKCTFVQSAGSKRQIAFMQTQTIHTLINGYDQLQCSSRCQALDLARTNISLSATGCEEFCFGDCPCLLDWSKRCKLSSCNKCGECFITTTTTTTKPPILGFCTSTGDPHIKPFDRPKKDVDILGPMGDYWVVRSNQVHIQARYGVNKHNGRWASNAHNKLLGITGPFIKNSRLVIGTTGDSVTFNGGDIMDSEPSEYSEPNGLFKAIQTKSWKGRKKKRETLVLKLELPLGMVVTVNRYIGNIDYTIQMFQLTETQDGHCGNFNEDATDDTENAIKARMMINPAKHENVFESNLELPADYSYTEQTVDGDCEEPTHSKAATVCQEYMTESDIEILKKCMFDVCFLANSEADMHDLASQFGVMEEQEAETVEAITPFACDHCCGCRQRSGAYCMDGTTPRDPKLCYTYKRDSGCEIQWPYDTCKWTPPQEAATRLLNKEKQECMTSTGDSMVTCSSDASQEFKTVPTVSTLGVITIVSSGGECLTEWTDGYHVWAPCKADDIHQKWTLKDRDGDDFFSIQSHASSLCIEAPACEQDIKGECKPDCGQIGRHPDPHCRNVLSSESSKGCAYDAIDCTVSDKWTCKALCDAHSDCQSIILSSLGCQLCKADGETTEARDIDMTTFSKSCLASMQADGYNQQPYVKLGDGYCDDWKYLKEGAYPDHLTGGSSLYSSDRVQECMNRCLDAAQTDVSYGSTAFYVQVPSNKCACSTGTCHIQKHSSNNGYVSYAILKETRVASCSGGDRQRWKSHPLRA